MKKRGLERPKKSRGFEKRSHHSKRGHVTKRGPNRHFQNQNDNREKEGQKFKM